MNISKGRDSSSELSLLFELLIGDRYKVVPEKSEVVFGLHAFNLFLTTSHQPLTNCFLIIIQHQAHSVDGKVGEHVHHP